MANISMLLNAQFNRAHISERDFEEAADYLLALRDQSLPTIQRALLLSAIVAYSRPFTQNQKSPSERVTPQLGFKPSRQLNEAELKLHELVLGLRNQVLAHSEFTRKPTNRVMGSTTGFLVQSRPFDLLSERIDRESFASLCSKMKTYCDQRLFDLNHKLGPTSEAP